ncbi:MAG: hypothetical protein R3Y35_11190 [Clostridia bacterium]
MNYIKTCVYVLITAMVLSLVLAYASMMTIIQTSKDNTERVLESYITQNSIEVYGSIKNGTDFIIELDEDDFNMVYDEENPLTLENNHLYSENSDGTYVYRTTIPSVSFTVNNSLNLTCEYEIKIPIQFAGESLGELIIPITVKSTYNFKS